MTLSDVATISDISAFLRSMGDTTLADRLDYLASDEDLEPGESPATVESARGFFELFASVESDSEVGLSCSPEGWIVGEWWFPDGRVVGIWFLDANMALFSAINKNGEFVNVKERNVVTERSKVTQALVKEDFFLASQSFRIRSISRNG